MNNTKINTAVGVVVAIVVVGFFMGGLIYKGGKQPANVYQANQNNVSAQVTELQIQDVQLGTGAEAKIGDRVTVHYIGTFTNGQKFDSSLDRGQPFEFVLGEGKVIAGWEQGVAGMKVGGKRKLVVPPALGYGPNDYGPIPGNSTLMFEIELLKVGK